MTLIKRNENYPIWSNLFNDFFNQDWNDWSTRNFSQTNTTLPSVNIKEEADKFTVEMAAPGLTKSDFKIEIKHGVLSISSEKKNESETKEGLYSRKEFSYESFCRSFSLPTSVESEKVSAKYDNGILKIEIPKRDEAKIKRQG